MPRFPAISRNARDTRLHSRPFLSPDSPRPERRGYGFRAFCAAAVLAGLCAFPRAAPAASLLDPVTGEPDVARVLAHFDDLFRSESSIASVRLTVTRPRRTQTMEMTAWTRGTDKALIVIKKPDRDAGTATLKVGDNIWNYLPKIARTIRIPPSMMLSSWMGSDFTNDDLVRESSLLTDFSARLAGPSSDPPGWTIDLTAKEGVVGLWQKIEYVTTPDAALPLRALFYDRRGRLARTMIFEDVRSFGGRRIPARLVLIPADKEGQRTEMTYIDVRFNVEVPDSTFSLSRLEQNR